MKELLKEAQDRTILAFSKVYDLVNECPSEEVRDSYIAVKRLLSLADDILRGEMETDYKSRFVWQEIKKFIEEKKS